jgi:hypothetical protein
LLFLPLSYSFTLARQHPSSNPKNNPDEIVEEFRIEATNNDEVANKAAEIHFFEVRKWLKDERSTDGTASLSMASMARLHA